MHLLEVAHMYRMMRYRMRIYLKIQNRHLIEMGATLPDNASYEPLLLQLKVCCKRQIMKNGLVMVGQGESLWQKDAAIKLIRRGGFETTVDHILFANGGQNAIATTLASLCMPGDRVGVDHHTSPGLRTVAAMFSVQLVPIKSENYEMSPTSFEYECKNDNIKGIYLIPDYHNPTASFMSVENRKMIAAIAKKYKLFVIEDASYHLLGEKPLPAVTSSAPETVIYIASLSKSLAPGLRLAYVAVRSQFKELISKALYNLNITVSPLLAELAARTIVLNQFEVLIEGHREQTICRNQIVNRYFADYTYLGVETGIFRWLLLPGQITGAKFETVAAGQGVQVYAAERFVVGNRCPERAVRVSVCHQKRLKSLSKD